MRRLVALLLLLFGGWQTANAYTVAQSAFGSGTTTAAATFSSSVAAGSVIVTSVTAGTDCTGWTVNDTVNSGNYTFGSSNTGGACFFWIVANATGTPTVTVTASGGYSINMFVHQLTGWVGTPTADATLATPYTATNATIAESPITTAHNNEFLWTEAAYGATFATGTPSGWTVIGGSGLCNYCVAWAFEATSGTTNNFSQTLNASTTWYGVTFGIYDLPAAVTGGSFPPLNHGFGFSPVSYTPQAATPTFSPTAGSYSGTQTVTISSTTPSSSITYCTTATTCTPSISYSGPVSVASSQILFAFATASGYSQSATSNASYTISGASPAATPTFTPAAGSYGTAQTVSISTVTGGATITYCVSATTCTPSTTYTTPITVSSTETVYAFANASGYTQSTTGSAAYTITGSGPATPTVLMTQSTSGCSTGYNDFTGCTTNTQYLNWGAVSGATSYTVYRNINGGGYTALSGCTTITPTTCTDATATNTNGGNTYTTETAYGYYVIATNGSGNSSPGYAATYIYQNGPNQACSNYSSSGYSGITETTTSGNKLFQVTAGSGILPFSWAGGAGFSSGTPPFLYVEPWNSGQPSCTGGTATGTGGTGYYCASNTATSSQSGGSFSAGTQEGCYVTQNAQAGHTYDLAGQYGTGGYIQQYASPPLAPQYDLNLGAMNTGTIALYISDLTSTYATGIHSRPGGNGASTGDIFSHWGLTLLSGATPGTGVTCSPTPAANQWTTCTFPLVDIGIGVGTVSGSVSNHWHGTGTLSGSTVTISTTIDGATTNIVNGDVIVQGNSDSGVCTVTGISGLPASFTVSGCNAGSGIQFYDTQFTPTSTCSGSPIDNGGWLRDVGTTMPVNVYIGAPNAGTGGVASCSAATSTTWGLGTGSNATIPSVSSTTFNYQRISAYKPAIVHSGSPTVFFGVDNFGFTH